MTANGDDKRSVAVSDSMGVAGGARLPLRAAKSSGPPLRSPLRLVLKQVNRFRCKAWDLVHGVDTCGEIPLASFDFKSEQKTPGLEYQSHHPRVIRAILSALDIERERFTFIDYGCGKGRVLLIAGEFGFRRIIGVEFVPALAETAKRNLTSYRGRGAGGDATVFTMSAIDYELPPDPSVLFFYSPFTGAMMERVVENIENSFKRAPRELFVLFTGLEIMREKAFGCRPQYKRLRRERYFDVYRHEGNCLGGDSACA